MPDIDFGDDPVGTPPTSVQVEQIKDILTIDSGDIVDASTVGRSILSATSYASILESLEGVPITSTINGVSLSADVITPISAEMVVTAVESMDESQQSAIRTGINVSKSIVLSGNPTSDTTTIQDALNAGGYIKIDGSGTYDITTSLVIGSNTTLEISDNIELRMKAGSELTNMLQSSAYNRIDTDVTVEWNPTISLTNGACSTGSVTVSATSTTGAFSGMEITGTGITAGTTIAQVVNATTLILSVSATSNQSGQTWICGNYSKLAVTWSSHGLVVGDFVYLSNANQTQYIGVFPVTEVVNANKVILTLERIPLTSPTAVSGSIRARKADVNISVIGGKWNHNSSTLVDSDPLRIWSWYKHTILLIGIAGLTVRNVNFTGYGDNAGRFSLNVGALRNYVIDGVKGKAIREVCKVYGPLANGNIRNISASTVYPGATSDDALTIHTKEDDDYSQFRVSYGDILNLSVCNVSGQVSGSLVHLYGSPNELMSNVHIDQVSGTAGVHGVGFSYGTVNGPFLQSVFGTIRLSNIRAKTYQTTINLNDSIVDSLVIEDSVTNPLNATSDPHFFSANNGSIGTTIRSLVFSNCAISTTVTDKAAIKLAGINNCEFVGCFIGGLSNLARPISVMGTCLNLSMIGCNISLGSVGMFTFIASVPVSTEVTKVFVSNCNLSSGLGYLFNCSSGIAVDFTFVGNIISGLTDGLVRAAGGSAAVTINGFGNKLTGNSKLFSISPTPTSGLKVSLGDNDVSVTFGTSITPSFRDGMRLSIGTLSNNLSVLNPTTIPAMGTPVDFYFNQNTPGGWNVFWGTSYVFPVAWSNSGNNATTKSFIRFVSTGSNLIAQGSNSWYL